MNKQEEAIELAKGNILIHLALSNAGRTSGHLMVACGLQKGHHLWDEDSGLPHSRILDRALQGLRKAGKIRFANRQWELV